MPTLPIQTGPMAFVERQLEALSARDRKLLVGLFVFGGVILIGGLWYFLHGILDDKASRVRDAKSRYAEMQVMQLEYRQAAATLAAQESRLRQYQKQPVTAYIEQVATKHGIVEQLRNVSQQGSETVGRLVQTRYSVDIKKAPQENLMRFLYELETSGFPASVEQADFKVSFVKRDKFLDLSLDLVVTSLGES
jgi:hypothetical protein